MRWNWCFVAVLVAACGDSTTGPAPSDAEFDNAAAALMWGSFSSATPDGTKEVACPGGGKIITSGSRTTTTVDGDQTVTFRGESLHLNCTSTSNGRKVVTNGMTNAEGSYTLRLRTQPFTYLALQIRAGGTMTHTLDGKSETCNIQFTMSYDPNTNLLRMAGTICGRAFDNSQRLN